MYLLVFCIWSVRIRREGLRVLVTVIVVRISAGLGMGFRVHSGPLKRNRCLSACTVRVVHRISYSDLVMEIVRLSDVLNPVSGFCYRFNYENENRMDREITIEAAVKRLHIRGTEIPVAVPDEQLSGSNLLLGSYNHERTKPNRVRYESKKLRFRNTHPRNATDSLSPVHSNCFATISPECSKPWRS